MSREALDALRRELKGYLHRLMRDPQCAEDLAQETFVRALRAQEGAPCEPQGYRRWLFRIATNLAIDAMRRDRRRREVSMLSLREEAEGDPAFVEQSKALIGTPEIAAVAREHLTACFACALTQLSARRAAALLLTEVHAFSVAETAEALGLSFNAAKNAIQDARSVMVKKYDRTCALIAKTGVCHQCEELADFFCAEPVQIAAEGDRWASRIAVIREFRARSPGVWHTLLLGRASRAESGRDRPADAVGGED